MSALTMLTIYDSPADHPGFVVLTSWAVWPGFDPIFLGQGPCNTVDEARAIPLAAGMHLLPRSDDDDPCVVESWI